MSLTPLANQPSLVANPAKTLVVVPTYQERENLAELVARFFAAVPNCEMLVVDDASPDGTADICKGLMSDYGNLHLLRRAGGRGLGRAYVAGFLYGLENGYAIIGTMDADMSHDPRYIPAMLDRTHDYDVVIGSRYIRDGGTINWRIRRILLSWLANEFSGRLLKVPVRDLTSGFRLYRSSALRAIRFDAIKSTGYSFLVELLYRLHRNGFRILESPIVFYDRTGGASKLGRAEIFLGAFNLLRLKWSREATTARNQPS
jgi:glycosyltransferase involved in cell wall biosynthesis